MKYLALILPILLLFSENNPTPKTETSTWQLVKEKGPLKVFTRKSHNSEIKELRITTKMNASLLDFIKALRDADGYKSWVYKCLNSKLIKRVSNLELYYLVKTDFPFPFSDRDLVVHTVQEFDDSGVFYSNSISTPGLLPEEEGVVRIQTFETHWKVIPQDDDHILVEYHSKVDPAGQIPQWMVNIGLTTGPFKTLEKFTDIVEGNSD